MEEILRRETLGFLGVCDAGQPYIVPLTYAYLDGIIVFHCALEGKKLDCIRANPRVCFTAGRQFGGVCRHPQGAHCSDNDESVICYGIARILTDEKERLEALNAFNRSIQPDAKDLSPDDIRRCHAVEIRISEMTGRQRRDGGTHTFWKYSFRNGQEETT
ncbi:MAG: pyridoxamine 5'-phosphate oxidase family protein [Clostridiales bacterium]|nr:pyridoxamine 5'-phosphate oxidase family protein [Clostridiales bacterium]